MIVSEEENMIIPALFWLLFPLLGVHVWLSFLKLYSMQVYCTRAVVCEFTQTGSYITLLKKKW
jgi:hypothetical protein